MTHGGFVLAAWIIVAVSLGLNSMRLVMRGRALTRAVAPERRRWMHAVDDEVGDRS